MYSCGVVPLLACAACACNVWMCMEHVCRVCLFGLVFVRFAVRACVPLSVIGPFWRHHPITQSVRVLAAAE